MPSGLIWEMVAPGNCINGCLNPETGLGAQSGNWRLCQESSVYSPTSASTVNYLDNFTNFVNKFCADCNTNFNNK